MDFGGFCPFQIMENAEINSIIKIVGLQYKKNYEDEDSLKTLRYGKIMIMTDQVRFAFKYFRLLHNLNLKCLIILLPFNERELPNLEVYSLSLIDI